MSEQPSMTGQENKGDGAIPYHQAYFGCCNRTVMTREDIAQPKFCPFCGHSLATAPPSASQEGLEAMKTQLAEDILRRIALRYRNCEVHIYPDLPELTPVEGVLRCAQEEGFRLVQGPAAPSADLLGEREAALEEAAQHWRAVTAKLDPLLGEHTEIDEFVDRWVERIDNKTYNSNRVWTRTQFKESLEYFLQAYATPPDPLLGEREGPKLDNWVAEFSLDDRSDVLDQFTLWEQGVIWSLMRIAWDAAMARTLSVTPPDPLLTELEKLVEKLVEKWHKEDIEAQKKQIAINSRLQYGETVTFETVTGGKMIHEKRADELEQLLRRRRRAHE